MTVPFTDPVTDDSPVTVSGRVSRLGAAAVELVYPDGGTDSVALGERGFYVADVPSEHLTAVHRHGLLLVARDGDGTPLAQAVMPHRRDHAAHGGASVRTTRSSWTP